MVKLTRLPSSLGSSPAKQEGNISKHTTHVIPMLGHTNRTVETTCDHRELLEVGKDTPLRRDSTDELVGVADAVAKDEHLE